MPEVVSSTIRWLGVCCDDAWQKVAFAKVLRLGVVAGWMVGWLISHSGMANEVPAWRLVWSDEFDLPDGSAPNTRVWNYDVGGHGWGNGELQYHTNNRRANARIEGGNLVLEARQEIYRVDGKTYNYTSARLNTARKMDWTYGRVEARIQIPRGQGLWPAFWMIGRRYYDVGWPACGEIDIMENIGREPRTVHAGFHGPEYFGSTSMKTSYNIRNGGELADDFHLFALDWEPNRVRISIDNIVYFDMNQRDLGLANTWVFNEPFFVILNVAVGGNWPGAPDATTVFPQRMLVDYVRVYEATTAPAPVLNIGASSEEFHLRWSAAFPHAQLQRAEALGSIWTDLLASGVVVDGEYVAAVPPGWFRLR